MRPAFLDALSWEMAEVYGAISDQILINLARHFPYYKPGDPVPRSAFVYQADMLAQMGQVNSETMRIIRNGLGDADEALKRSLETSIIRALRTANPELWKGVKAGIIQMPSTPVVAPNQMRAFQLYYQQAANKLNLVNTVMLESTQQAYQSTITDIVSEMALGENIGRVQTALDVAAGETITGVSSWNTAVRHATQRMTEAGITGFIDHGGHRWSAEAYAAMDIRTTMANTARAAVWEQNERFGNDLYLVSYHNGARPLCYPWQNKVISSADRSGTTYDLDGNEITIYPQSSTSYGEPAGLFGINCGHMANPFIPGVSIIRGEPQSPEENEKTYQESQEQRRLERKLREQKRDVMMAKAQGAPQDEIDALTAKQRATSREIDDFCEQTGRTRRRNREGVYTKREFPEADSYDPSTFVRDQKDEIDKFFGSGGAQQGYTFGQMTQNVPITPANAHEETADSILETIGQRKQSIAGIESEIQGCQERYSELFTQSITTYGTEEHEIVEKALAETQDKVTRLYSSLEEARGELSQYLSTSGEPQIRGYFGEISGTHGILSDARSVNIITEDLRSQNNCGYCSLAFDARRRGIDCHAPLIYGSNDMALPKCWEGAVMQSVPAYDPRTAANQIKETAESWGVGSRGIVEVDWSSARGHYFMFEVGEDGACVFVDGQTGLVGSAVEMVFDNAVPGSVKYCRTDDKGLTKQALLFLEKGAAK